MLNILLLVVSLKAQALPQVDLEHLQNQTTLVSQVNCQDDHYLMTCFRIDKNNCISMNEASYTSCLNMKKAQIEKSKANIADWKKSLGDCTIKDVEKRLISKSIKNKICQKGGSQ